MKKLFLALLAITVVSFTGCGNKQQQNNAPTTGDGTTAVEVAVGKTQAGNLESIAYINIDSLLNGYDFASELRNSFEAKYNKAERELQARFQKLEKEAMEYQEKAQKGLMTRSMMAETEQRLATQQQQLMQDRDKKLGELAEEEQVTNNRIYYAISEFIQEYNADYKYGMILTTTASGPVLHAHPSMNITKEVLKGLNERYAQEKTTKK